MTCLEVIATSLEDAVSAAQGGADSVEICINLPAEGLTPPLSMVRAIRDAVQIDMNVMLRPHNNGAVYDELTIRQMLAHLEDFKTLGIQSLVFGAHNPDGTLNIELIRQFAEAATPLPLTVHRALEWSTNPDEALPQLVGIAQRILTAGPASSTPTNREGLRQWVEQFRGDFRFAAASGIRLENILAVAHQTEVDECHVGTAARTNNQVDPAKVRQLKAELQMLPG